MGSTLANAADAAGNPALESHQKSRRVSDKRTPVPADAAAASETPELQPRPTQAAIAARAYDLFLARGGAHGCDLDDWLRAERELGAPGEVAAQLTRDLIDKPAN